MSRGRKLDSSWEPWSSRELMLLDRSYSAMANPRIAEMLGRSVRAVISMAQRRKLRKDCRRLRRMGRENRTGKTKLQ